MMYKIHGITRKSLGIFKGDTDRTNVKITQSEIQKQSPKMKTKRINFHIC